MSSNSKEAGVLLEARRNGLAAASQVLEHPEEVECNTSVLRGRRMALPGQALRLTYAHWPTQTLKSGSCVSRPTFTLATLQHLAYLLVIYKKAISTLHTSEKATQLAW